MIPITALDNTKSSAVMTSSKIISHNYKVKINPFLLKMEQPTCGFFFLMAPY